MQPSVFTNDALNRSYTTAIDALCEIARAYFFLGRGGDALHLLQTTLSLAEADEVAQTDRLKLLLLSGRVLIVDHLLHRGDPDLMFSTVRQAQQRLSRRGMGGERRQHERAKHAREQESKQSTHEAPLLFRIRQ